MTIENVIEVFDMNTLEMKTPIVLKDPVDQFIISPSKDSVMIVCILVEHFIGFTRTEAKLTIYDYKTPKKPVFE